MSRFPWEFQSAQSEEKTQGILDRFVDWYGVIPTFVTVCLVVAFIDLCIERDMGWGLFAK